MSDILFASGLIFIVTLLVYVVAFKIARGYFRRRTAHDIAAQERRTARNAQIAAEIKFINDTIHWR